MLGFVRHHGCLCIAFVYRRSFQCVFILVRLNYIVFNEILKARNKAKHGKTEKSLSEKRKQRFFYLFFVHLFFLSGQSVREKDICYLCVGVALDTVVRILVNEYNTCVGVVFLASVDIFSFAVADETFKGIKVNVYFSE